MLLANDWLAIQAIGPWFYNQHFKAHETQTGHQIVWRYQFQDSSVELAAIPPRYASGMQEERHQILEKATLISFRPVNHQIRHNYCLPGTVLQENIQRRQCLWAQRASHRTPQHYWYQSCVRFPVQRWRNRSVLFRW